MKEDLLELVPTERSRYTSLGALVFGTAAVGTVSMWVALTQVTDAGWAQTLVLVVPALAWGLFVLTMDRALITSAAGSSWWTKIPTLLVRFALAGVLGMVIAEPLVLQLFGSAIEQEIGDRRDAEVDQLRDRLIRCNPVPGAPAPDLSGLDCTGALIDPGAVVQGATELDSLRKDEIALQQQIAKETGEKAGLDETARRECAGEGGDGLSGRRGVGPLCREARSVVDEYVTAHPPELLTKRLETVRDRITGLGGTVADAAAGFEESRNKVIAQRVQELVDNQEGVGLLERFASLDRLTSSNDALWLREWFIRLVLVVVDCLPVMVKFLGGATSYDRIVDRELSSGRAVHQTLSEVGEDAIITRLRADQSIRRDQIDADIRRSQAEVAAAEDDQIDQRRQRYLNRSDKPGHRYMPGQRDGERDGRRSDQSAGDGGGRRGRTSDGDLGVESDPQQVGEDPRPW